MASSHDESILRSLRRITRAIDLYSRELAAGHRLTVPQLICLRHLVRCGQVTSGALAAEVTLSQATVTGILDRLESRRLVLRRRDDQDKRRVLVAITPAGRALVSSAPAPLQKLFSDRLAELAPEEQAAIDRILGRIVQMMSADELDAAPILTAGPAGADAGALMDFLTPEAGGKQRS